MVVVQEEEQQQHERKARQKVPGSLETSEAWWVVGQQETVGRAQRRRPMEEAEDWLRRNSGLSPMMA